MKLAKVKIILLKDFAKKKKGDIFLCPMAKAEELVAKGIAEPQLPELKTVNKDLTPKDIKCLIEYWATEWEDPFLQIKILQELGVYSTKTKISIADLKKMIKETVIRNKPKPIEEPIKETVPKVAKVAQPIESNDVRTARLSSLKGAVQRAGGFKWFMGLAKPDQQSFLSDVRCSMQDFAEVFSNEIEIQKKEKIDSALLDIVDLDPLEKDKKLEELSQKFNVKISLLKSQLKYVNKVEPEDYNILTRRGQLESFWKIQPFYYDKNKIFWLWDKINFKWIMADEIDYCNLIYEALGLNTIDSQTRGEIVESFKQVGRKHKPMDMKKSWVQFKNKIHDVKTGEEFEASPEYFISNPIPWSVGKSEETPTIDKYFSEWMNGQDPSWKNTLYEIIAYNISSDKFMQRLIALVGGGSNGKGTFIKLNERFLGKDNHVVSEMKSLSENRFASAVLYKKLLCVMGEVSFDDLKNTNFLKKVSGEDKLSFEYKGKNAFTDENTATCICLTNSMPITPDKTLGFYRRWIIVDFPNQFSQINKNLIESIPESEFENLARKCLRILKEMYQSQKFTNEGDFEERAKRYEERSNPVLRFVEELCSEEAGKMIPLRDFTNACNEYLKSKHLRILNSKQIGHVLRNEGFIVGTRKINDISTCVIVNISLKDLKLPSLPSKPSRIEIDSHVETKWKVDGNDGNDGFINIVRCPSCKSSNTYTYADTSLCLDCKAKFNLEVPA